MTLLLVYLALAIGVSFLCSLTEAVLLTLNVSDAEMMTNAGKRSGARLKRMKTEIDRPLAAILTLNTISHTIGAAGVGAQSAVVFGKAWLGLVSAVLTLLILVVSEIIPKTIGATYARPLAGPTVAMIRWMIWLTYPVVVSLNALSKVLRGSHGHATLTREEMSVYAELARAGGQINPTEHAIITNMLRLRETRVGDVMTPRTVVAMASHDATARETMLDANASRFSRLPISGDGPDDIRGQVLRSDLSKAVLQGTPERTVQQLSRPLHPIPDRATLMDTMHRFRETGAHMFLAVDEYGGTAGVITLEDVLETILGAEIVDETDPVADMRSLVSPLPPIDGVGGPPERASSDASGERPADGG